LPICGLSPIELAGPHLKNRFCGLEYFLPQLILLPRFECYTERRF
jgi:hypothetical protein